MSAEEEISLYRTLFRSLQVQFFKIIFSFKISLFKISILNLAEENIYNIGYKVNAKITEPFPHSGGRKQELLKEMHAIHKLGFMSERRFYYTYNRTNLKFLKYMHF